MYVCMALPPPPWRHFSARGAEDVGNAVCENRVLDGPASWVSAPRAEGTASGYCFGIVLGVQYCTCLINTVSCSPFASLSLSLSLALSLSLCGESMTSLSRPSYRGISLIKKRPPFQDPPRTLDTGLL